MKRHLLLIFLFAGLAVTISAAKSEQYSQFEELYRKCDSPEGRRTLCIKAVDDGLIEIGMPITAVEKMFGSGKGGWGQSRIQKFNGRLLIHFEEFGSNVAPDGAIIAAPWHGWYLLIRFRDGEHGLVVSSYYFSDVKSETKAF